MHYGDAMARRSPAIQLILSSLFLSIVFSTLVLSSTKKPPLKPVNINAATSEELQQVPGIGPATAEKILQMRKSYGLFKSVDDLLAIKGIGKKRLDKMRKYLTVGKPTPTSKISPQKTPSTGPSTTSEQPPPATQP
jgi:competence protein ComEA